MLSKEDKQQIKDLKAQLKAKGKASKNKGSGKVRFMGFCKVLLGLTLLAPVPAALTTGIYLGLDANKQIDAARASFTQTVDYQNALENREQLLKQNEEDVANGLKSPKKANEDREYYMSQKYFDDIINMKNNNLIESMQDKQLTGIMVSTIGTLVAAVLSVGAAALINSKAPVSRHQFDMIGYGAKEFWTGEEQ